MNAIHDPNHLAEEAKRLYALKDYKHAADVFASAAGEFQQRSDELMAAEMKNNQSVALLQDKQYQSALDALTGTEEVFSRAGDLRRQGMACANQAAVLDALKRREDAIRLYEKAAELLASAGAPELRADVMRSLAAIQVRKGQGLDAVISMQDGLSGIEKPSLKQRIFKKLLRFRLW